MIERYIDHITQDQLERMKFCFHQGEAVSPNLCHGRVISCKLMLLSGNRKLHTLTSSRTYILRVDLEDFENEQRYAVYGLFSVGSEDDGFRITVGGYSGNAGETQQDRINLSFLIPCT